MTVEEYLEGLRAALLAFVRYADRAGLDGPVPTTPDWSVRQLIAHQGMVHRWSAAMLRGEEVDPAALERAGRKSLDPVEWLRDGAIDVARAITEAPDDVQALVFLADAPPARTFWARRQCHETTMHAVDALSAVLGRRPKAADTWLGRELALDGIDELVTGFIPRRGSRLRSEEPTTILVDPTDDPRAWLVKVGDDLPVTERLAEGADDAAQTADVVLRGGAVALYLTLWNRSDEITPERGDWDLWPQHAQVRWSR